MLFRDPDAIHYAEACLRELPDEAPMEDTMPHKPEDCNCWSDGKPDPECPKCGGRGVRLTAEEA